MSDLHDLTKKVKAFRDARDWKQFHTPKDSAICLALEASEVLECFQFKKDEDVDIEELKDELADVLWWVLLMSEDLNIDIKQALEEKLQKTEKKYPVEKAKGSSLKYTKF